MSTPDSSNDVFTVSKSQLAEFMTNTVMDAANQAIAKYLNDYADLLTNTATITGGTSHDAATASAVLSQISRQIKEHAVQLLQPPV